MPTVSKPKDIPIVSEYKLGYRNREDVTNLPPGVLIVGSQNVLTNVSERVQIRKGYALDGAVDNTTGAAILSSFDWLTRGNGERHLRAGFLTSAGNDGKLQYRYVSPAGLVTWRDLTTGLSTVDYNFTQYWKTSEALRVTLFVNGTSNIFEWNGAYTEILSATATTLTKDGDTWLDSGFYSAANKKVIINGVEYTYTGGESTNTLTGVTPSPLSSTIDQSQTTQNSSVAVGEQDVTTKYNKIAQSFIVGQTNITGVKLYKTANTGAFTGTVTVSLLSDVAGNPSNILATVTIPNATYNALPVGEFEALFGTAYNSAVVGTKYWIYVETSTSDTSNHPNLGMNISGGYTSGSVKYYATADGWTDIATIDLYFKTLYAVVAGDIVHQSVVTTANSAMTGITSTFKNGLIKVMNNQIFLGSLTSSVMWLSKVNDYTDYSSSATRQIGEGGSLILDANLVGFIVQGTETLATMWVSAGKDIWYKITFTNLVNVVGPSGEVLGAVPIKSGKRQGAISQAFISNMKNNVIAVSNEPTVDMIGLMENYFTQVQSQNISDPIKLDIDSYDFTDGSIFYFKYFIYVAIPLSGIIRIFNLVTQSWEAPQTIPVSRFYIVDGELYGHSYNSSESYKLFTGYADRVYTNFNGQPISAKWVFSYQNFGTRTQRKSANRFYIEGYIAASTIATATITYELDGCATTKTFTIDGSDNQIVCLLPSGGGLGKQPLGKLPFGGGVNNSIQGLPPKFRVEKTFNNTDFFECSISFSVIGIDDRLELLAFGLNAAYSTQEPVSIRQ